MWTRKQALIVSRPDGSIEVVRMRYNATHQRGWRCFLDPLASDPAAIDEDTPTSFHGHSLFDALVMFRATIEPAGGRLLQAMASRECWADPKTIDRFCRRLTPGSADPDLVDGFLPITPDEAATLDEQRAAYEAWLAGLPPAPDPEAPMSAARKALNQTNAAIRAAGEAAILARGDLAKPPQE